MNFHEAFPNIEESGALFARDYSKFRIIYKEFEQSGAENIILQQIMKNCIQRGHSYSTEWLFYVRTEMITTATSAEAERSFTCLRRLRCTNRRRHHRHLPCLMSISLDDHARIGELFISQVVKAWSENKHRRQRPTGIGLGVKRPRTESSKVKWSLPMMNVLSREFSVLAKRKRGLDSQLRNLGLALMIIVEMIDIS